MLLSNEGFMTEFLRMPTRPSGMIPIRASLPSLCANAQKLRYAMIPCVPSALAEPTGLSAMQILNEGKQHCVCDMRRLKATQSRMSRHMRVPKQAGLVVDWRDAQWVRYRIRPDLPSHLRASLAAAPVDEVMA